MSHATHPDTRRFAWAGEAPARPDAALSEPLASNHTALSADSADPREPTHVWGGSLPPQPEAQHPQTETLDPCSPWQVAVPQLVGAPLSSPQPIAPPVAGAATARRSEGASTSAILIRPPSWRDGIVGLVVGLVALAVPIAGAIAWGIDTPERPTAPIAQRPAVAAASQPAPQPATGSSVSAPSQTDADTGGLSVSAGDSGGGAQPPQVQFAPGVEPVVSTGPS